VLPSLHVKAVQLEVGCASPAPRDILGTRLTGPYYTELVSLGRCV